MWPFLNESFLRAFIKCSDGGFLCYTLYFKHFVLNCTFYFKRKSKKYPCFLWSFPFKCCSYRRMKCNIVIKFWICVCGGGQYMWFTRWLHTESLSSFACCFSKTDSLYTAIHEPLALSLSLSLSLKDRLPLAVVGSNTIIEVNGKKARGRQYPWGVAEGRCTWNAFDTQMHL